MGVYIITYIQIHINLYAHPRYDECTFYDIFRHIRDSFFFLVYFSRSFLLITRAFASAFSLTKILPSLVHVA